MLTTSKNSVLFLHRRCWQRRSTWSSSGTRNVDNVDELGLLLEQEMLTTSKHLVFFWHRRCWQRRNTWFIQAKEILTTSENFVLFLHRQFWQCRSICSYFLFGEFVVFELLLCFILFYYFPGVVLFVHIVIFVVFCLCVIYLDLSMIICITHLLVT